MIHFALECFQRMFESQNVALVSSVQDSAEGSTSRICEQRDLGSFTATIGRISAEYVKTVNVFDVACIDDQGALIIPGCSTCA